MLALSYGYLIFRGEIILTDEVYCVNCDGAFFLEELPPLIQTRPASAVWFGQQLTAGLQYEVPSGALCEALFETLQTVRCTAW